MTTRFEALAEIRIGYKSLLNDFFYVDAERVAEFGIEEEFLTPIFRIADLKQDSYVQRKLKPKHWVFTCKKELADLTGTGALTYIRWGARQETRPRKQSAEKPVRWSKTPALSHVKHWFWPAARMWKTPIAVRKAFGQRYAPFIFDEPTLLDQRMYLVLPKKGVSRELMAAFLSSSLFPLALETNANLSLGVGYLTLGTKALRRLPCPDLRAVARSKSRQQILEAADDLWREPPVDASAYPESAALARLDEAFLGALGISADRRRELAEQVAHFASVRLALEGLKEAAPAAASKQDVRAVAENLAVDVRQWLDTRRFPEDYFTSGNRIRISIPVSSITVITTLLMDRCFFEIFDLQGNRHLSNEYSLPVAEVILRSLQMGRREFDAPARDDDALQALNAFEQLRVDVEEQFQKAFASTSLGSKYEQAVRESVSRITGILPGALGIALENNEWILERE